MDNRAIAQRLVEYAQYLDSRDANVYRLRAYRRAAETVLRLDRPVESILSEQGREGLEELPGIGSHLSYTIDGLVRTGEFRTLNREGGTVDAERLFASLPGVGPRLARAIHEKLGVETLEQLEQAAHEGKLEGLAIGSKRVRGIRDALAGRLGQRRWREPSTREPEVDQLLKLDQEYRTLAEKGLLPTIAPRRFNLYQEAWLPLMTVARDGWNFRLLYSNTATAHRLRKTHDWVVIYFHDGVASGQRTIVTESRGELAGKRVVRGRESESD